MPLGEKAFWHSFQAASEEEIGGGRHVCLVALLELMLNIMIEDEEYLMLLLGTHGTGTKR